MLSSESWLRELTLSSLGLLILWLDNVDFFFFSFAWNLDFGETSHDLFFNFLLYEFMLWIVFLLWVAGTVFWVSSPTYDEIFLLSVFFLVLVREVEPRETLIFLLGWMAVGESVKWPRWDRSEKIFFDFRGISILTFKM